MRRFVLISTLLLLLIGILAAILYLSASGERISTIFREMEKGSEEPFSVLVLGKVGVGQGGQWHFAPDLTDTIFVVYFNPGTKIVNLISLPRDLYGDFGETRFKINKVVSRGEVESLMSAMPEIIGIETSNYVVLELGLVEEVVNGLGGITVNLPEAVYDPVGSFYLDAGENNLNGEEAVWLVRNRYAPEGDFFRERNQHLVLEAIFAKFNSLSSLRKTSFIFNILPQASKSSSNFSLGEAISNFKDIQEVEFNSVVLDFDTNLWNDTRIPNADGGESMYVLIPREGINQYRAVRNYVQERLK